MRAPGKDKAENGVSEAVSEVTIHNHWILSVPEFLEEVAHTREIVGDEFKEKRN